MQRRCRTTGSKGRGRKVGAVGRKAVSIDTIENDVKTYWRKVRVSGSGEGLCKATKVSASNSWVGEESRQRRKRSGKRVSE